MYYPKGADIEEDDIASLYEVLRNQGLSPDKPKSTLNVALHTSGGESDASYRLAQLLCDFGKQITFIVPEYAYSGGTVITLAGEKIVLGHYAVLSPIDIGFEGITSQERREPIAMDHYIKMAANAKVEIVRALQNEGITNTKSAADKALMTAMVENPDNAIRIATLYRQRNTAEQHARQLLENYMLKNADPERIDKVIAGLITEAPDHNMDMDYHICANIGLIVQEAEQELSDLSKQLVRELESASESNLISQRKPNFYYIRNRRSKKPAKNKSPHPY